MSARDTYHFGDCTLRPATGADLDLAREWTAADEVHKGTIAGNFWIEQGAGVDCYLLSDGQGPLFFYRMERAVTARVGNEEPVYFFRLEPAVRLLIQFSPVTTEQERQRTRRGLIAGARWLAGMLGTSGVGEIFFDSTSKLLRRFVTGELDFDSRPDTLSRRIQVMGRRVYLATETGSVSEPIQEDDSV